MNYSMNVFANCYTTSKESIAHAIVIAFSAQNGGQVRTVIAMPVKTVPKMDSTQSSGQMQLARCNEIQHYTLHHVQRAGSPQGH